MTNTCKHDKRQRVCRANTIWNVLVFLWLCELGFVSLSSMPPAANLVGEAVDAHFVMRAPSLAPKFHNLANFQNKTYVKNYVFIEMVLKRREFPKLNKSNDSSSWFSNNIEMFHRVIGEDMKWRFQDRIFAFSLFLRTEWWRDGGNRLIARKCKWMRDERSAY